MTPFPKRCYLFRRPETPKKPVETPLFPNDLSVRQEVTPFGKVSPPAYQEVTSFGKVSPPAYQEVTSFGKVSPPAYQEVTPFGKVSPPAYQEVTPFGKVSPPAYQEVTPFGKVSPPAYSIKRVRWSDKGCANDLPLLFGISIFKSPNHFDTSAHSPPPDHPELGRVL